MEQVLQWECANGQNYWVRSEDGRNFVIEQAADEGFAVYKADADGYVVEDDYIAKAVNYESALNALAGLLATV